MPTATITKQWLVANNGGWAETFNFFVGSAATPDNLSGCVATLTLVRPGRPPAEALAFNSTDTPAYLTVAATPAAVTVALPNTVTSTWIPGLYDVQLRVYAASPGVDRYNLVGPGRLNVIEAPGT